MSQISVVQFNTSAHHKLNNILQQNNNGTTASDRQVIVLRKGQHILPQPKDYARDDILLTNTARKGSKKSAKEIKVNPQPTAVARRNARERNRVKQVNNGFANLRQHIPNFIAETFENSNGRGGNKKLSKVETLRMAVEYIRSLEDILALDSGPNDPDNNVSSYHSPSNCSIETKTSSNFFSNSDDDDDLASCLSTPPPQQQVQHQYIRINTTNNTFEIVPTNSLYENSENLDPLSINTHLITDPSLIDPNALEFGIENQDLSYLNVDNMAGDSLSPEMYSDGSLSPTSLPSDSQNCFLQVFDAENRINPNFAVRIKTEISDLPVISVKTESELPESQKRFVEVMNWWDSQPQQSSGS